MKYYLSATVVREIREDISLTVEAESRREAERIARNAALTHPYVETEGVHYLYIENRDNLGSEIEEINDRNPIRQRT